MDRVAVVHCTPVMQEKLFGERRIAKLANFGYPAVNWDTTRSQIAVFRGGPGHVDDIQGVGLVQLRNRRLATFETQLSVEAVTVSSKPVPVERVRDHFRHISDALSVDGPLGEDVGNKLLQALIQVAPELEPAINALRQRIGETVVAKGPAGEVQGMQRDATHMLFDLCAMDRGVLRNYVPRPPGTPFLAGLLGAQVFDPGSDQDLPGAGVPGQKRRVNEDQLINHDMNQGLGPGWFPSRDSRVGWSVFSDGMKTLEVYNSNRANVERETGVDLIYHDVENGSFVMVQYKAMRPDPGRAEHAELRYRPKSDRNLYPELDRMRALDEACLAKDIAGPGPDLRLIRTPCFVKLCEPQIAVPDSDPLIRGMYLSRHHFESLLESAECRGPSGAIVFTFSNVPRYFTNQTFAELFHSGWIGTQGAGTELVRDVIKASEAGGRAVVAGLHHTPMKKRARRIVRSHTTGT